MGAVDNLLERFRSGSARIDLDHAELIQPDGTSVPLNVPAFIQIQDRRLTLHLRESAPAALSPFVLSLLARDASGRVLTSDDYLTIDATADNGMPVRLEDVVPACGNERRGFVRNGGAVTNREIRFYKLALMPIGSEGMTLAERNEENIALGIIKAEQLAKEDIEAEEGFSALIPQVELKLGNSGVRTTTEHPFHRHSGFSGDSRCFTGSIFGGEFCLEKTDEGDLAIRFRRIFGPSKGQLPVKDVFNALAASVGFLHSCNPWPYYFAQWSGGKLVERWLKAPADCVRDCLEPAHISIYDENAAKLFVASAKFFAGQSEEAEHYRRCLWLMREACRRGTAMEVRLLTLCSILEGLQKRSFDGGQSKRERWTRAFAKASVTWDTGFDAMFDSWESLRNLLAHGFDPHPDEDRSPGIVLNAYSRITAGIYILMAKRMGFTGWLWRSRFEGDSVVSLSSGASLTKC